MLNCPFNTMAELISRTGWIGGDMKKRLRCFLYHSRAYGGNKHRLAFKYTSYTSHMSYRPITTALAAPYSAVWELSLIHI